MIALGAWLVTRIPMRFTSAVLSGPPVVSCPSHTPGDVWVAGSETTSPVAFWRTRWTV
jgi:hypothetical protein